MDPTNDTLSLFHNAAIAQSSATLAYTTTHPIWNMKNRYQLGLPPTRNLHILYRGLPFTLAYTPLFTLQCTLVEHLRREGQEKRSALRSFSIISLASCTIFGIGLPTEQIVLQMQKAKDKKPTIVGTAKMIYAAAGVRGFYRGAVGLAIKDLTWSFSYFYGEKEIREQFYPTEYPLAPFACGSAAGLIAWGLSQGPDTVGTIRQGDFEKKQFANYTQIIKERYRQGGIQSFYGRASLYRLVCNMIDMSILAAVSFYSRAFFKSSDHD